VLKKTSLTGQLLRYLIVWPEQVSTDGLIMADGTRRHKTMPDGMSERNEAIALEEYHS